MKNIELNAGGVIGALTCGLAVGAFIFWKFAGENMGRTQSKFLIGAFIAGAFAGNFLWQCIFKKPEKEGKDAQSAADVHPPN